MSAITVTGQGGIGVEHVADVARRSVKVSVAAAAIQRVAEARAVLDRVAASGQQIYGLNTGLGANLGTAVAGDAAAFQHQLVAGRSGAVGNPLPTEVVRATMFTRVVGLA